jgi:hypothetical protein
MDTSRGALDRLRVADTAYRENTAPPLLPVPGARVHVLQREGGFANLALMGIWMGTITFVSVVSMALDGHVPEALLPWIALPLVLLGLVAAGYAHFRITTGGSAWRLHLGPDRRVLERTRPSEVHDLARTSLRKTRYEYSFRGGRGAMPTVSIELPGGTSLVVTGPIGVGWQNLSEEDVPGFGSSTPAPDRSRAPDVRLDDAAAFAALTSA